jgi:peptidase E
LTKEWIEAGDNLFGSHHQMVERYGPEVAERLIKRMLQNYTRLVFINTGKYRVEHYREYSKNVASRYDLRFEEIKGSPTLVDKIVNGSWDKDFVVVSPGQSVPYEAFC